MSAALGLALGAVALLVLSVFAQWLLVKLDRQQGRPDDDLPGPWAV